MTVYKVKFHTYSKGKDPKGRVGNIRQSTEIAFVECRNTSCVEVLLEVYYQTPTISGAYYVPVIDSIEAISGFCIIEGE